MLKLNKQQMHQRPTYETLVRDTVLNPKDKINLPNRQATLLKLTQKLQMFDDESFIDIDEENKRIAAQRMQQVHLQEIVSEKLDTELKTEKILQNQETDTYFDIGTPRQSQDMQQPKHMASSSAQEPTTKHMQSSSSKEPSHLPPSTIEADLELATFYQDSIDKNENQLKVKKKTIKDIVGKHLGHESGSINKPYVNTLVDLQNQTHVEPMDTSTDPNMDTSTDPIMDTT